MLQYVLLLIISLLLNNLGLPMLSCPVRYVVYTTGGVVTSCVHRYVGLCTSWFDWIKSKNMREQDGTPMMVDNSLYNDKSYVLDNKSLTSCISLLAFSVWSTGLASIHITFNLCSSCKDNDITDHYHHLILTLYISILALSRNVNSPNVASENIWSYSAACSGYREGDTLHHHEIGHSRA